MFFPHNSNDLDDHNYKRDGEKSREQVTQSELCSLPHEHSREC